MTYSIAPGPRILFWHRRDLRAFDNRGLSEALKAGAPGGVLGLFIYDRDILDDLEDTDDPRLTFIHDEVRALRQIYQDAGGDMLALHGRPLEVIEGLIARFPTLEALYTNHDYEPYAKRRDGAVGALLEASGRRLVTYKDQVIFERGEVLTGQRQPFGVYTPYSRQWRARQTDADLAECPVEPYLREGLWHPPAPLEPTPTLAEMGFERNGRVRFPSREITPDVLGGYADARDLPGREGTSRLSLHLRFGTVSVRRLVALAREHSDKWLSELIWREFYMQVLDHHPRIVDEPYRPEFDRVPLSHDQALFDAWCRGETGYPIVDAGMRQLNEEYWMHNRVRMIVASFLTKHLLQDWRLGQAYFASKLLDFELASNLGGWQWALGGGVDAAPYFRVFNPALQQEKFDPEGVYIRRYVPEYGTTAYPAPIVDHATARRRALEVYGQALRERG